MTEVTFGIWGVIAGFYLPFCIIYFIRFFKRNDFTIKLILRALLRLLVLSFIAMAILVLHVVLHMT
ncbi:MAG: hypothetical protein JSW15_06740, partial [Deltaproteobacteria bacterium]